MSKRLSPSFNRSDVQIVNRQTVYQGYFKIEKILLKHQLFAGGQTPEIIREVFERPNAAGILLFDPYKEVFLMIEQFRIGLTVAKTDESPWLYEIVAGIIEPQEQPQQVAIREAKEEANCEILELLPIAQYWVSPGGSTEYISLYCGKINAPEKEGIYGNTHENEDIRVCLLPMSEAMEALKNGRINNAHSLVALQWFAINQKDILKKWRALG
jgi:ADP-ribose pyrophosphatase